MATRNTSLLRWRIPFISSSEERSVEDIGLHNLGQQPRKLTGNINTDTTGTAIASSHTGLPRDYRPHHRWRLTLYTTGAYGVQSQENAPTPQYFDAGKLRSTHHRLYDHAETQLNWKPRLSGRSSTVVLFLILLGAIVMHMVLVSHVKNHGTSLFSRFTPAILGMLLTKATVYISVQEYRRTETAIHIAGVSAANWRFRTWFVRAFVTLLIVPFLSLPVIRSTYVFKETSRTLDIGASHDAEDLGDYTFASIPPITYPTNSKDMESIADTTMIGDTQWVLSLPASDRDHPGGLRFAGTQKGNELPLFGAAKNTYATVIPFFHMDALVDGALIVEGKSMLFQGRALRMNFECEKLVAHYDSNLAVVDHRRYIHVTTKDSYGCSASFSLQAWDLDPTHIAKFRDMASDFDNALEHRYNLDSKDFDTRGRIVEYRQRLAKYMARLQDASDIVTFQPVWKATQLDHDITDASLCRQRLIVAGFTDPLVPIQHGNTTSTFQAASCTGDYYISLWNPKLRTPFLESPFRDLNDDESYLEQNVGISTLSLTNISDTYDRSMTLVDRKGSLRQKLDGLMDQTVTKPDLFGPDYLLRLLQYQFLAMSAKEATPFNTIMYAAQKLMLTMMEQISITTSILSNKESRQKFFGSYVGGIRVDVIRLKTKMLQTSDWLVLIYRMAIFTFILCTITFWRICYQDRISYVPWDTSSIAAKAIMLNRSRLVTHFIDSNFTPRSIDYLRPLRIGYWTESDQSQVKAWRVDSMLREFVTARTRRGFVDIVEIRWYHRLLNRSSRYSRMSLRYLPFIIVALSAYLMNLAMGETLKSVDPTLTTSNIIPMTLGVGTELWKPFWKELTLKIVPSVCIMYIICHMDDLVYHYKRKQPWIVLANLQSSRDVLTLDYVNPVFPLRKALRNHHWFLANLLIGTILLVPLPLLLFNFYHFEWRAQVKETIRFPASFAWNYSAAIDSDVKVAQIFKTTLSSLTDTSVLPKWSSYDGAILPIDLSSSSWDTEGHNITSDQVNYWEVDTDLVRAELSCEDVRYSYIQDPSSSTNTDSTQIFTIRIFPPHEMLRLNGSSALELDLCLGQPRHTFDRKQLVSSCIQWHLVSQSSIGHSGEQPVWIIMATDFYRKRQMTKALLCQPKIFTGKVTAHLMNPRDDLDHAIVNDYKSLNEEILQNSLAEAFSRYLYTAMLTPRKPTSPSDFLNVPGQMESSIISTPRFTGDMLSMLTFQWAKTRETKLLDGVNLARASNRIFSTIFAVAVQQIGFLNTPTPGRIVEVHRIQWQEHLHLYKWAIWWVIITIGYILVLLLCHEYLTWRRRKQQLPYPPEKSLENSWYYLYESSLVRRIGEAIPEPEKLSLEQFYAAVDALDLQCAINYPKSGNGKPRVDVTSELQNTPYKFSGPVMHVEDEFGLRRKQFYAVFRGLLRAWNALGNDVETLVEGEIPSAWRTNADDEFENLDESEEEDGEEEEQEQFNAEAEENHDVGSHVNEESEPLLHSLDDED